MKNIEMRHINDIIDIFKCFCLSVMSSIKIGKIILANLPEILFVPNPSYLTELG